MARNIKTTIYLDGGEKYQKQLKQINAKLTNLSSEMNVATSSFNSNNNSILTNIKNLKSLKAQQKLLGEQISTQHDKVKTLNDVVNESSENYASARASLEDITKQYGKNSEEVEKAEAVVEKYEKQLSSNVRVLNEETANLNKLNVEYDNNKKKINALNPVLKVAKVSAQALTTGLVVFSKVSLAGIKTSIVGVGKALKGISTASLEAINKTVDVSVKGFETYTKVIGETAKALGEMSVEKGMDFSSQMSNVQALMGYVDNTKEQNAEMEALEERAKEIGATTKFTATEVAQAYENMAKAGWKSAEMLNSINGVMSLSSASGEELDTVTKVLTNSMTSLGYEVTTENTSKFVDTLATVVTNANTNVEELGEAFKYVGSTGKTLGYTIEDLSVGLGLMANNGIVGQQAGNALKSGLQRLVNPTENAQAVMDELGISLVNVKGETASFDEVLLNLKKSFGTLDMDLKDSEGNLKDYDALMEEAKGSTEELQLLQQAGTIFGKQQVSNWLALIQSETEDYEQLTDAIANSEGMAEKMSEVQLDNLTGDFTILKSAVEGVGLAIYDYIEQPLRELTQTASEVTSNIQKNIEGGFNLDGIKVDITFLKKSLVEQFNGMSTEIINSINSFSTIFNTAIEELLSGVIEVAPALIGDGVPLLTNSYWNLVSNLIEQVGESAPELIESGAKAINSFITGLISTSNKLKDTMPSLISALSDGISDILPNILNMGGSILSTIASGIVTALPEILSIGTELLNYLSESLQGAPDFVSNIFSGIRSGLVDNLPALLESMGTLISSLLELLTSNDTQRQFSSTFSMLSNNLINFITEILPTIVDAIPSLLDTFIQPILDIFTNEELLTSLMNATIELLSQLLVFVSENAGKITSAVVNLVTALSNALIDNMDTILPAISEIIKGVLVGLSENIDSLLESLLALIGELALTLTSDEVLGPLLDGVTTLVSDVLFALVDNIPDILDAIMEVVGAVVQIISEPENIKALCEMVGEILSDVFTALPDILASVLSGLGGVLLDVVGAIKDWIDDGDWKEIGKNIIEGLANGIEDSWGKATDAITNVGNKIVDKFKEIFDINSPSEVMKDKIGKFLLPGVAEGVEDTVSQTSSDVQKSINKMVSSIKIDGSVDTITSKLATDDTKIALAPNATTAVIKAKGSDILPNTTNIDNSNTKNTNNSYQNQSIFQGAVFNVYNDMDVEEIARKLQSAIQMQNMGVGVW